MGVGSLFITALIIGFSGAMMPGPLLTATINESYHRGTIAGPRLILGHGILELILIIGLMMGLGEFLLLSTVKGIIATIGGLFLLWMGWGIARNSLFNREKLELAVTSSTFSLSPEVIGIFTSLSNPYWSLWWATVGLHFFVMRFPAVL
ncbi:LysE family transporter [Tepidibacillus sp. LV47]|uniref:LysE family transporter n=1 Tax=Tepidibacillus sp. LV47 TaxID=3398228 RepID=UPI003AAE95B5